MDNNFLSLLNEADNFKPIRGVPVSEAGLEGVIGLIANTNGHSRAKRTFMLQEAMTTSDFPFLLGQVLDRQLLAMYRSYVPDWRSYIKVGQARDFRTKWIMKTWGGTTYLSEVKEEGEYKAASLAEAKYTNLVKKYGRTIPISWESIINDDLGAFNDIAQRLAMAAQNTEYFLATSLIAASTGPHTSLYGATITDVDAGVITNKGALPLTISNLETTLKLMAAQRDVSGNPINIQGLHLVVPIALEFTARHILRATTVLASGLASTSAEKLVPQINTIPDLGIQLHVNPWLSIIDTTKGTATWYVFADPAGGPAAQMDFLAGYESPQIAMKATNKVGATSPMEGDFEHDTIMYRVRHVLGGTQLDPRFTYAQTGS